MDGEPVPNPSHIPELKPSLPHYSLIGSFESDDVIKKPRNIYKLEYNGVSCQIIFHSPLELPTPLPESTNVIMIGSEPGLRSPDDLKDYREQIKKRSARLFTKDMKLGDFDQGIIMVNSSIGDVINLARTINPESQTLKEVYNRLAGNDKTVRNNLVNLIIAGKFIDENGLLKQTPDDEGEMLFVMQLLGDQKAAEELNKRAEKLNSLGPQIKTPDQIDPAIQSKEGLKLADLVAVHTTDYPPEIAQDGQLHVRNLFDSTKEQNPRLSLHFALNHLVGSHHAGSWDERKYIVLAPFLNLVQSNTVPFSMRAEDTSFMTRPGEPLVLPDRSIIVIPASEAQKFKGVKAEVIMYNDEHLTAEDIKKIEEGWEHTYWGKYYEPEKSFLGNEYNAELSGIYHPSQFDSFSDYINEQILFALQELRKGRIPRSQEKVSFWDKIKGKSVKKNGLEEFILHHKSLTNSPLSESDRNTILKFVINRSNQQVVMMLKKITVDSAIRKKGYKVENIDPQYLTDLDFGGSADDIPDFEKNIEEIALQLGVSTDRHPYSPESNCTDSYLPFTDQLSSYKRLEKPDDNSTNEFMKEAIGKLIEVFPRNMKDIYGPSRIMYYLLGVY